MTYTPIRTLRDDVDRVQSSSSASSSPSTNRHIATFPLQHSACTMTTIIFKRDWWLSSMSVHEFFGDMDELFVHKLMLVITTFCCYRCCIKQIFIYSLDCRRQLQLVGYMRARVLLLLPTFSTTTARYRRQCKLLRIVYVQ